MICATGYDWEIPYIAENSLPWHRGRIMPPLSIFAPLPGIFLLSFVESNGSSFSLFNEMSWVIGRAIAADAKDPAQFAKLGQVIAQTDFDVTGGLHMLDSDRHVGYMNNETYRKSLIKLRKLMGWPTTETAAPPPVTTAL